MPFKFMLLMFCVFAAAAAACRRCTRVFLWLFIAPCSMLCIKMHMQACNGSVLKTIPVLIEFVVLAVVWNKLAKHLGYDFSGKVISINGIWNVVNALGGRPVERGVRAIGRVLPYNEWQLKYNQRMLMSSELAAAGGMLISGSTGSGKTYGILSSIRQNIHAGDAVIFAEYKGDPKVVHELREYALANGYQVYTLSAGKSDFSYDPLRNLNNSGRVEAIINMRKWSLDGSDAHFRTGAQLLLQKTVGDWSHEWVLRTQLAEQSGKSTSSMSYTMGYLDWMRRYHPSYAEQDAYATVTKLLELMTTGSLHSMFGMSMDRTLSLDELRNQRFLLLISFPSSNKELATSFSSMLFRDLLDQWTAEPPKHNTFLYVDEFGTLDNPFIIKDILEKGRSAKLATTLSLQDINQIVIQTNDAYLNSLLGTVNSFIVYSGATRNTAERLAGVQLANIEAVLMNLRKPINGQKPTAIYISKYPSLNRKGVSEVFRFEPYIFDEKQHMHAKNVVHVDGHAQPVVEDDQIRRGFEAAMLGELDEQEMELVKQQEQKVPPEGDLIDKLDVKDEQPVAHKPLKLRLGGHDDDCKNDGDDGLNDLIFGKRN